MDTDKEIEQEKQVYEKTLRSFDQYLTAMSAAAVSLSFTYYSKVSDNLSFGLRALYFWSFASFTLSLLAVITSQLTSSRMSFAKVRWLRHWKENEKEVAEKWYDRKEKLSRITDWLNHIGYGLLLVGLILFFVFAWKSTNTTKQCSNERQGKVEQTGSYA